MADYLGTHHPHLGEWTLRRRSVGRYIAALNKVPEDSDVRGTASELTLRFQGCGRLMLIGVHGDGSSSVYRAFRCGHRLCPKCAPDLAREVRGEYQTAVRTLCAEHHWKAIELTLTLRNVEWPEVEDGIEAICAAYRRLLRLAPIKAIHKGSVRVVEVTKGRDGLSHVHLHVVMLVPRDYGKRGADFIPHRTRVVGWQAVGREKRQTVGDGRQYRDSPWQPIKPIIEEGWVELWRQAGRVDYDPAVRVQLATRPRKNRETGKYEARTAEQAVGHAIKYALKPFTESLGEGVDGEALAWLADAVHGRRLVEPYGALREYVQGADEDEDKGDWEDEDDAPPLPETVEVYRWARPVKEYERIRVIKPKDYIDLRAQLADLWPVQSWDPIADDVAQRQAAQVADELHAWRQARQREEAQRAEEKRIRRLPSGDQAYLAWRAERDAAGPVACWAEAEAHAAEVLGRALDEHARADALYWQAVRFNLAAQADRLGVAWVCTQSWVEQQIERARATAAA